MHFEISASYIALLILFSLMNAYFAKKRGYSPFFAFFLSLLLSPLITVGVVYFGSKKKVKPPKKISIEEGFWFYLDDQHEEKGPVSGYKVQELIEKKVLSKNSYLWKEGMEQWKTLQHTSFNELLE